MRWPIFLRTDLLKKCLAIRDTIYNKTDTPLRLYNPNVSITTRKFQLYTYLFPSTHHRKSQIKITHYRFLKEWELDYINRNYVITIPAKVKQNPLKFGYVVKISKKKETDLTSRNTYIILYVFLISYDRSANLMFLQ